AHIPARALHAGVGLSVRLQLLGQLAHDIVLGVLIDLHERLPQDLRRLLALLGSNIEAIPAVADSAMLPLADGHIKTELWIDRIPVVLPQIPPDAGAAEVRA